jgi:2-amino-4-hydroxy-6-hydroxymethyldihydropteridine diphosphokinase
MSKKKQGISVYLALGSNLGDRLQYIEKAIVELEACGLKMIKMSTVIETDPIGGVAQGKYLNAVLKASTIYSPEELHVITRGIEHKLGRIKKTINAPRVIDIDILLYDDIKLITPQLLIPHPRCLERPFVMQPLEEIDPALCASLKR